MMKRDNRIFNDLLPPDHWRQILAAERFSETEPSPPRSSQMSTRVRMCMERLRTGNITLDDYTGPAEDIACDLLTAEACISAIAQKIINDEPLPDDLRQLASLPLLDESNRWRMPDGRAFDLSGIPILRDYARQIERLRQACAESLP